MYSRHKNFLADFNIFNMYCYPEDLNVFYTNKRYFPSIFFKETESPVQATAKAKGGLWNKKSNNVDSGWQPSLLYVTPTKTEYDNDKTKTLKNEWELGGNLRQSIKD